MKKNSALRSYVLILSFALMLFCSVFISGCNESAKKEKIFESNGVIDGNIPVFLVGKWKADNSPWEVNVGKNGEIVSAVVPMGEVEVKPNQITRFEMHDGSISILDAGNFLIEYIPSTREFSAKIELKRIHVQFMDQVLDGNSTDYLMGTISEDRKTWTVNWMAFFDYGPRFPADDANAQLVPLIFKKIENQKE